MPNHTNVHVHIVLLYNAPFTSPKKWHTNNHRTPQNIDLTREVHTHGTIRGCGLTSLVICTNGKTHDVRKTNATIRTDIWIKNICSVGFRDIKLTCERLLGCWLQLWRQIQMIIWVEGNLDEWLVCSSSSSLVANGKIGLGKNSRATPMPAHTWSAKDWCKLHVCVYVLFTILMCQQYVYRIQHCST